MKTETEKLGYLLLAVLYSDHITYIVIFQNDSSNPDSHESKTERILATAICLCIASVFSHCVASLISAEMYALFCISI